MMSDRKSLKRRLENRNLEGKNPQELDRSEKKTERVHNRFNFPIFLFFEALFSRDFPSKNIFRKKSKNFFS